MSRIRSFAVTSIIALTTALPVAACSGPPPPLKGKVVDTYFKDSDSSYQRVWTASIQLADGSVVSLGTSGDEDRLKTKVHIGDCVSAKATDKGFISDVADITVYHGKENCFAS
jgi:hypothetical protein